MTTNFSHRVRAALVVLCVGFGASWVSAAELWLDDQSSGAAPTAIAQSRLSQSIARAAQAAPGTAKLPSPAGAPAKRTCLVLENTVTIDGAAERAYGMMCAGDDGVWRLVPF